MFISAPHKTYVSRVNMPARRTLTCCVWCPLRLTAVSPQGGSQVGRTSTSLSTAPVDEQWSLEAMCAPAVLCGPFASAISCGQALSQHDGGVDDSRHGVGRSGVGSGSGSVGTAGEGAAAPAVDCTASPVTSSVTNSSVAASAATSLRPWMWLWLLLDVAVVIVVVWVAVAATRSTSNLFSAVRDPLSFYNRFLTDATARVNTVCHTGQAPCFCAWDDAPPQCWLSADCPLAQVCAPTSTVPLCLCCRCRFVATVSVTLTLMVTVCVCVSVAAAMASLVRLLFAVCWQLHQRVGTRRRLRAQRVSIHVRVCQRRRVPKHDHDVRHDTHAARGRDGPAPVPRAFPDDRWRRVAGSGDSTCVPYERARAARPRSLCGVGCAELVSSRAAAAACELLPVLSTRGCACRRARVPHPIMVSCAHPCCEGVHDSNH